MNVELNKMSKCPHIYNNTNILDLENLGQNYSCTNCDYSGGNLWICLNRNCLRLYCSETANDHSTCHFENNNLHCLHMNISSNRSWCYLCECEVFLEPKQKTQLKDLFSTALCMAADTSLSSNRGLVGLHNLANTCYMNSALQALSHVQPMTNYFLHCGDLINYTLEQTNVNKSKAGLAKSYHRLIQDIWLDPQHDSIAPRGILYGIRTVHPMFRGFLQHDTQEFLRCFMDQLHDELQEPIPVLSLKHGLKSIAGSNEQKSNNDNINETQRQAPSPTQNYLNEPKSQYENIDSDDIDFLSGSDNSSVNSDTDYETCDSDDTPYNFIQNKEQESIGDSSPPTSVTSRAKGMIRNKCNSMTLPPEATTIRSIISDVFDGKLLSSVQCLTCDRVSNREETFQDLSLPIPNRDYMNLLRQNHSLSSQSLTSIDSISLKISNNGWISWFLNVLRAWLWGPPVTLYDCMASFFSADELKGDNMYSCEKCNKLRTGIKYSRILDPPEILCIHLKRFRHDLSYSSKISKHVEFPLEGFDMKPYLDKECTSRVSTYQLSSVICHHGTVGGGHYICLARNWLTNRWYEFDDNRVTEITPDAVQNSQAYVLFYQKFCPQNEFLRAEAKHISAEYPLNDNDVKYYINREWISRFSSFSEPGPINNWTILCPHGGLLNSKVALEHQIAVPVSHQLWEYLYRKFGGGPAINEFFECEICKGIEEALERRQLYELTVFTKYGSVDAALDSSAIYAISSDWLRRWQMFVRNQTTKDPGPITNKSIAVRVERLQSTSPIYTLRQGSDYSQVHASLWRFLYSIYGGGPEIKLSEAQCEQTDSDEYMNNEEPRQNNRSVSDTESHTGVDNIPSNLVNNYADDDQDEGDDSQMECSSEVASSETEQLISNNVQSQQIPQHESHSRHGQKHHKKPKIFITSRGVGLRRRRHFNVLKSSELFGTKGHYSSTKETEEISSPNIANNDSHSISTTESNLNHSLDENRPLSPQQRSSTTSPEYLNGSTPHSKKSRHSHKSRMRREHKNKNTVVLKKIVNLEENNYGCGSTSDV